MVISRPEFVNSLVRACIVAEIPGSPNYLLPYCREPAHPMDVRGTVVGPHYAGGSRTHGIELQRGPHKGRLILPRLGNPTVPACHTKVQQRIPQTLVGNNLECLQLSAWNGKVPADPFVQLFVRHSAGVHATAA